MVKFEDMKPEKQRALLLLTRQIVDPDAPRMTYDEIALEVGISERQLFNWRTQDDDFKAVRKQLVDSYASEMISEGFSALRKQIRNRSNVKAVEVLFKSQGMLIEKQEVTANITTEISEQSNSELLNELDTLRAKVDSE
ncbi:phBC6A51 family helix-turn-helix protein [Desulfosporosinus sp. SB140]|uniref:phBC6A51 family helix-turn-helix protein n=1 Tax=Desulfosporosinus paludis TaxID=3115649 RepID=UPI00388D29B2